MSCARYTSKSFNHCRVRQHCACIAASRRFHRGIPLTSRSVLFLMTLPSLTASACTAVWLTAPSPRGINAAFFSPLSISQTLNSTQVNLKMFPPPLPRLSTQGAPVSHKRLDCYAMGDCLSPDIGPALHLKASSQTPRPTYFLTRTQGYGRGPYAAILRSFG